jgi:5'-nucleotidase/UDP-sugar diphosphatase
MRQLLPILALMVACDPPVKSATKYGEYEPLDTGLAEDTAVADDVERITILHTNDWQSHMLGFGPNAEYSPGTVGDDSTVGGLARAKTLIDEIRGASTHPVVLYDAGDWMAGALFQLLATTHAAELQMMQMLGYDGIAIGNHELDWGPNVLGEMISKADELGVTVPILASNIVPNRDDPGDDALEAHFDSGRVSATHIQTLDSGLTVGLFGLIGDEAARITPAVAPASFEEAQVAAAAAVETLQAQGVDIIIALSHAGVGHGDEEGEDEAIAEAVDGIDVIVSGHSHTALHEHIMVGDTIIVQAGAYTRYVGELTVSQTGDGWAVDDYTLHELDDTIIGDPGAIEAVDGFVEALNAGPLAELGVSFSEPIFQIEGDIDQSNCEESGLGNFVTDAFRHTLSGYSPDDPIVAAFESQGVIRDDFLAGATGIEAFSDVFRVMPLGIGNDGVPGYGLVDFYVTSRDLKSTCEIIGSIVPMEGCDYWVEPSGLRCHIDMDRAFGNTARKVDLLVDEEWVELDLNDRDTLYHVAVDSYVASLMNILGGLTFDAVVIKPKLADGTVVEDTSTLLFDKDPDTDGVQEVKLWEAVRDFAQTFPDTSGDGIPDIPARYMVPEGRLVFIE